MTDEARAGEPRTEAGRALQRWYASSSNWTLDRIGLDKHILAIEREAIRGYVCGEGECTRPIGHSGAHESYHEPERLRGDWTDPGITTPNPDGSVTWRPTPPEKAP